MNGKVIISRNVIFNEGAKWNWQTEEESHEKISIQVEEDSVFPPASSGDVVPNNSNQATCSDGRSTSSNNSDNSSNTMNGETLKEVTPISKVRSLREIYESCFYAFIVTDPITFEEAITKEEWQQAMKDEIMAIQKYKTWELSDLPKGKETIGLKWIYKTKYHADGTIHRHKARLVAKGYSQVQGVDFE